MWIRLTLSNLQPSDPAGKGVNWTWLSHVYNNFDWRFTGGEKGKKTPKTLLSPSSTSWMKGFDSTLFFFSRRNKKKSFHILNSKCGIHHFFLLQFLCLGPEREALHLSIVWLLLLFTYLPLRHLVLCVLYTLSCLLRFYQTNILHTELWVAPLLRGAKNFIKAVPHTTTSKQLHRSY